MLSSCCATIQSKSRGNEGRKGCTVPVQQERSDETVGAIVSVIPAGHSDTGLQALRFAVSANPSPSRQSPHSRSAVSVAALATYFPAWQTVVAVQDFWLSLVWKSTLRTHGVHTRSFEAVGFAAEFPGAQSRHGKHEVWLSKDWYFPVLHCLQVLSEVRFAAVDMDVPGGQTLTLGHDAFPLSPCQVPTTHSRHLLAALSFG